MKGDLERIREMYGVSAQKGGRVVYSGVEPAIGGTISGARGGYIRVRLDGRKYTASFHPTEDMKYVQNA